MLRETIEARFPGAWKYGVGGFFFLRFVCPAIATPEAYQLYDGMNMTTWMDRC